MIALDADFVGEGPLRAAHQRGDHLADLVRIVVNRLLASNDQLRALFLGHSLDDLGDRQRLSLVIVANLDQHGAVRTHGQRGAQRFLGLGRADRKRDDLGHHALFLQADRFLDGNLVEGVHAHLDVGKIDAGAVGLDPRLHVIVDHALYADQGFHWHSSTGTHKQTCLR